MNTLTLNQQPVSSGFRVDVSRGERIGRVSSEWFSRPDDERYLNLTELYDTVRSRAERAHARTVESRAVRVEASRDDAERLSLIVPGRDEPVSPTHWSFGQLCSLVSAPASYMRQLPAPLAGINLQHGLLSHRAELVKTLEADDGRIELRAVTGPDYGRIWDHELVAAVMKIAGNGTGDARWKVPGVLDWATMMHNPFVDITKDTTTLYASDRDVFLFLVDDTHPIEAGRLPNGDPDLLSHDKFFLDAVRGMIHGATCTPLQISASAGGSSIEPWDIEREVKEGYLHDHMRLQDFAEGRRGDARDMRTVMRPLLEKYIRYRFPNQILEGKWLGDMLAIIRADITHPLTPQYSELDDINSYTAPFHHDPNTTFVEDEVRTYALRTIAIVGGC